MCVCESRVKCFEDHPIGRMLNRDQRTTVTLEYYNNYRDNNNAEKGYSDDGRQCYCEKNITSSNENILTTTKCDKNSLTKARETGYRNLSQFKLSK